VRKRRLPRFPRLGRPRLRLSGRSWLKPGGKLARFLFKSQILTVFLGLCALGILVGAQTRPMPGVFPYAELFDQLQVVSYRDTPGDSSSRFVVQLCAGGRVFSQYDVDARAFLPPPRGRSYVRAITGTRYGPLRVRGHVARGFWVDMPARHQLLPEQYDELYRRTLDFVKPLSRVTGVLATVSGYSVGYRIGSWNGSLGSRAVQQRVLATPDLGRVIAREAWRRVLLEPMIMTEEEDAARFATVIHTNRLYANFFRVALDDSDGFIPREAARLEGLGRTQEAHAMLAFAGAVRHASGDTVHMTSADFDAIERWATLLDQRGHWLRDAIPPPGPERIQLMGTLAWYGLAPQVENVDRVWVGPRMLVRLGDVEGFVTDEIPGTGAGCPISWRARLVDEHRGTSATVNAWLEDRPELVALAVLGRRIAHQLGEARPRLASTERPRTSPFEAARATPVPVEATLAGRTSTIAVETAKSGRGELHVFPLSPRRDGASLRLVAADSAEAGRLSLAAQAVVTRSEAVGSGNGATVDEVADTLRAHGVRDALVELPGAARSLGASPGGEAWSLALPNPLGHIAPIGRLRLGSGRALATATLARTSPGLIGVTVVADDGRTAALWSAALIAVDPAEARSKARQHPEIAVVLIEARADGRPVIAVESDLAGEFILDDQASGAFRVESF
jgi:hypothetical protein